MARTASMYAEVNKIFGDVIKVTPISKVVGDMAIYMLANNIQIQDVLDPKKDVGFPASVIEFFSGRLGCLLYTSPSPRDFG